MTPVRRLKAADTPKIVSRSTPSTASKRFLAIRCSGRPVIRILACVMALLLRGVALRREPTPRRQRPSSGGNVTSRLHSYTFTSVDREWRPPFGRPMTARKTSDDKFGIIASHNGSSERLKGFRDRHRHSGSGEGIRSIAAPRDVSPSLYVAADATHRADG